MYEASIPVLLRMLANLRALLEKGAAYAEERKFDPVALTGARLFPDMFPLTRQVQIAADMAKGCAARLAGVEPPKYEDNETTFAQLIERVEKTAAFLKTFKREQIEGSEQRDIVLKSPRGEMKFKGREYLHNFVLPNFYFHIATTYNILRHNGVAIGKQDFLGKV